MIFSQAADALGNAVAGEVIALELVVLGVVRCNPVRNRIDIEPNFLGSLGLANEHLPARQVGDNFKLGVVEVERLAIHLPIHLWVGEKYLGRAAFGDDLQHARLFKLFDRLCGEDHSGVMLAPCLLRCDDVVTNGLVLDEEPSLIQQEKLEGREPFRIDDFEGRAMQHIKEQRFENVRRVAPAAKVEGLEARKR
jgi:hypothetical protein